MAVTALGSICKITGLPKTEKTFLRIAVLNEAVTDALNVLGRLMSPLRLWQVPKTSLVG